MDEEANRIKQHIETEREQLGRNIDEIERRVKKATDFKTYFNRHTGWILGAAVGGGVLLARAFPPEPSRASTEWNPNAGEHASTGAAAFRKSHLGRLSETLDDIFDGLVAVVSNELRSFVADAVPGFREQHDAIERERRRA